MLTPLLLVLWGTSIPTGEIAGLYANSVFNFLRSYGVLLFKKKKRIFVCLA